MNEERCGGTSYTSGICPKCGKLPYYAGDIPQGGFIVGNEPYCVCGTEICSKCGQRYTPKCNHEKATSPEVIKEIKE